MHMSIESGRISRLAGAIAVDTRGLVQREILSVFLAACAALTHFARAARIRSRSTMHRFCHSLRLCCFLGAIRRGAASPAQKVRLPRGSVRAVLVGVLLAMQLTGVASARTSRTGTVIYGCYSRRRDSAELHLRTNRQCGSTETTITWNVSGAPGAVGAAGSRGPTGPTGRRGPAGGSWPDVAATLAGAAIAALSALGAAALTNRVARRGLRDEQARAEKAENEVRMRTFAALLTTARLSILENSVTETADGRNTSLSRLTKSCSLFRNSEKPLKSCGIPTPR